jgi:hypothetical protein
MNGRTAASRAAEIDQYIDGVWDALCDLPDDVRQELLEDLPDHLAEIAADDPASLDSRLGPPSAYAAELRAATGVEVTKHRRSRPDVIATLRPHAHTFDKKVGELIGYDRLVDFLVQLRPAWWILRGYLVTFILLQVFANAYGGLPSDSDAGDLGWVLVLVLVGLSIRVGRRPLALGRRIRQEWLVVGAVALVLTAFGAAWIEGTEYYPPSGGSYEEPTEVYVYTDDGKPVTNVQVYNRGGGAVPIGVPMGCGYTGLEYREQRGCIPKPEETAPDPDESPTVSGSPTPTPSGSGSATPGASASVAPSPS